MHMNYIHAHDWSVHKFYTCYTQERDIWDAAYTIHTHTHTHTYTHTHTQERYMEDEAYMRLLSSADTRRNERKGAGDEGGMKKVGGGGGNKLWHPTGKVREKFLASRGGERVNSGEEGEDEDDAVNASFNASEDGGHLHYIDTWTVCVCVCVRARASCTPVSCVCVLSLPLSLSLSLSRALSLSFSLFMCLCVSIA
jgi:hypothetical protein